MLALGNINFDLLKIDSIKPASRRPMRTQPKKIKRTTEKPKEIANCKGWNWVVQGWVKERVEYLQNRITAREGWDIRSAYTFRVISLCLLRFKVVITVEKKQASSGKQLECWPSNANVERQIKLQDPNFGPYFLFILAGGPVGLLRALRALGGDESKNNGELGPIIITSFLFLICCLIIFTLCNDRLTTFSH